MEDLSWVFEKLCNERGVKVTREVQRMLRGRTAYGLRELDFSRAYLPKKVYPVLADLVSFCCNAQTLNVSHGQVDNESLGHLELALAEHPSLTSLDFSHNDELSLAAGKQLLDAARANTNLLHVDLQHTAVSEVYQNRIQLQLELNEAQLVHAKELTNETGDDMGGVGKPCAVIRTRLQLGSAEGVDDEEWDDYSNPDDESAVAARLESEQRVLEHESLVLGSPGQPDEPDEELIVCPPQTVTRAPGELVTSVEPACRQNIETITTELFDSTAPLARWTDPVFPPSPASLITQGGVLQRQRKCRKVSWVRASQAAHIDKSRPVTLFHDQSRPSPPMPGVWANTYLLHSMSVLVRHPQLLTRLFTKARPEIGVYEVQISKGGKWLKVVVDDWLPCDADGLLCMRSADGNEMWPSLLEKAFAKLHGGWDRIERGSVTAALSDLTACVTHNIVLRNHRRAKEIVADGSYWATLRAYNRDAWIVAAAAKAASAVQRAALEETGIAPNRPYEVVSFVEAGEWRLVELFSPYAESADDPVWLTSRWLSEQPQAARQYLEPKLLPAIDRGSRWITFENFATYFDKVYVNRSDTSVTASYQQRTQRLVGEWTGPSAGGKLRCQYFTENPCWCLRVSTKNTPVLIQLSQQDPRLLRKGGLPRIGLRRQEPRPHAEEAALVPQDVVVTPATCTATIANKQPTPR
ncbi:Calpain-type cysteine protease DEK1 [Diplonema papillatum]|nr:Calpain-type cysteine protease DEK1 [Diplonema papillatum]